MSGKPTHTQKVEHFTITRGVEKNNDDQSRPLPSNRSKARAKLQADIERFLSEGNQVTVLQSHCDAYESAKKHIGGRCHLDYTGYGLTTTP